MIYLWQEKFWQKLPSDISNPYRFNAVLHHGISQGRRTTDKSLPSRATSFCRWRKSPFQDASSHLL